MIRLLLWLFPVVVITVPAVAFGFFLVAVVGSPGPCETKGRTIDASPEQAFEWQRKWDALVAELDAGRPATQTFTESESTARARLWAESHDVPVDGLLLCFNAEGGSASARIDVPVVPGDVNVLIEGTMLLVDENPEVEIERLEVGGLPSEAADLVDNFVVEMIEDQTEEVLLRYDYVITFADGVMTISGSPSSAP